jgi:aminopeptidase N
MWWGDAVTCSNWNEIWLNESFATYFQCLYTEHLLGKDEFDYNIYRNGRDAIKADSTIRKPIYTREGLTTNTYDKGSVVLNMLRNLLGDARFSGAMNTYITQNKHKPVVTKNLVDAIHKTIDEKMDNSLPANLRWFFEEWIYKAGQPEIEGSYTYDELTKEISVTAKQIQRLDSSSVFRTPFKYTIVTPTAINDFEMITGLEPKSHIIKLDSEPLCVIFNKGNRILCKLYFTKPKADWLYQLAGSEEAIDRITALKGLKDFINDDDVISAVLKAAQTDKFWGVRYEAAQLLSFSKNKKAQDNYITSLVDEKDSRVRRSFILGIGNYFENYPELQENNGVLASFLINLAKNETSYYAAADAITSLEKILKGKELYENALPFLEKDSHVDIIRRSTIAAIDSSNDPRSVDVLLYWAENGSIARLRNIAVNALSSFTGEPRVIDFLKRKLLEKPRSTQNAILGIMENSGSDSWKPALEELLGVSNDVRFKERVAKVIQKLN